ncbi:MAG: class I SAM-dependent methyltransferase [Chloroflexota bacterium]|nr:class I SAM-dependent methyltransferase [Chloroflexota bacterium]
MARWDRAAAWLPSGALRVLDDGAAFGFGTARVAAAVRRRAGRIGRRPLVVGLEYDAGYVAIARRCYSSLPFLRGSAERLPFADTTLDAILLLDVLEHLPNEDAALAEAWRVLRRSGTLIVSVPHAGLLAPLDSLNLYSALRERLPGLLPLDPTERGSPRHRHYRLADLRRLLGDRFVVERVRRTGVGLSEPLNLLLLLLCRGLLQSDRLYGLLRFVYFGAHLLEDLVPTGRWGYSVTVRARKA